MKLKTIKEMGNYTDAEMSIYEKIRTTRNKRNIKQLVHDFYQLPMFYLALFFSAIVSTFISLFLLIKINDMLHLVDSLTFDTVYILLLLILALNLLPLLIFCLFIVCLSVYHVGSVKEKEIEREIYKHE
jgi:ABC-type multidrug transport system fused ATPase/permease subunit